MTTSTLDAAGRPLRVGDIVGGTATQPHAETVIGKITSLTADTVTVDTPEQWTLPAARTFLIGRPLVGVLGEVFGTQLAQAGPALIYVTPEEDETRTVIRADLCAPRDARERDVCHALILHAMHLVTGNKQPHVGVDDGPALVYAASDRMTLSRVDTDTVEDERERAICRGLLKHALALTEEPVPVRVDEHGHIRP